MVHGPGEGPKRVHPLPVSGVVDTGEAFPKSHALADRQALVDGLGAARRQDAEGQGGAIHP